MRLDRRRALLAGASVGLSGLAGCLDVASNATGRSHRLSGEYRIRNFVERSGTDLVLDGDPYRYNGAMALLTHTNPDIGKQWVNAAMDIANRYGIDAYRCWGFPAIWDDVPAPHTAPGEFDDTWLERFDYTVAKAREAGVRLVVPLLQGVHVDAENGRQSYTPSPAAYGSWSDTVEYTDDPGDFVDDERANEYFREWIEHLLTRENQYTGIEYRDEPTILCWECANELEYKGDRTGESMADWYRDVAGFVKSLDANHLVGTGMHGSMGEVYEPWTERCAFVRDHQVDPIDLCSVHDYPIYDVRHGVRIRSEELARRYVAHKVRLAHEEVGKPVYVGEYGSYFDPRATDGVVSRIESPAAASDVRNNRDYPMKYPDQHDDGVLVTRQTDIDGVDLSDRNRYFRALTDVAAETGLNGVHFWRLSPSESDDVADRVENSPLLIQRGDESTLETIRRYRGRALA